MIYFCSYPCNISGKRFELNYIIYLHSHSSKRKTYRKGEVYMAKKVKLSEMTDMFKGMEILSLEGVKIEGDIEIDLSGLLGGGGFDPMLAAILGQESAMLAPVSYTHLTLPTNREV